MVAAAMNSQFLFFLVAAGVVLEPITMAGMWAVNARKEGEVIISNKSAEITRLYVRLRGTYSLFNAELKDAKVWVPQSIELSEAVEETYSKAVLMLEEMVNIEKMAGRGITYKECRPVEKASREIEKALSLLKNLKEESLKSENLIGADLKTKHLEEATDRLERVIGENLERIEIIHQVRQELSEMEMGVSLKTEANLVEQPQPKRTQQKS